MPVAGDDALRPRLARDHARDGETAAELEDVLACRDTGRDEMLAETDGAGPEHAEVRTRLAHRHRQRARELERRVVQVVERLELEVDAGDGDTKPPLGQAGLEPVQVSRTRTLSHGN